MKKLADTIHAQHLAGLMMFLAGLMSGRVGKKAIRTIRRSGFKGCPVYLVSHSGPFAGYQMEQVYVGQVETDV